jgi:hypothetical protein
MKNLLATIQGFQPSFHFPSITYQQMFLLFILFSLVFIVLSIGRGRAVASVFALYTAAFIFANERLQSVLQGTSIPFLGDHQGLGEFMIIYVIACIVSSRILSSYKIRFKSTPFFMAILVVLVEFGFVVSLFATSLSATDLGSWSLYVERYFTTQNAHLLWASAPILLLAILPFGSSEL